MLHWAHLTQFNLNLMSFYWIFLQFSWSNNWYIYIFMHFVHAAASNSWVLNRKDAALVKEKPEPQRKIISELVESLFTVSTRKRGRRAPFPAHQCLKCRFQWMLHHRKICGKTLLETFVCGAQNVRGVNTANRMRCTKCNVLGSGPQCKIGNGWSAVLTWGLRINDAVWKHMFANFFLHNRI